MRIRATLTFEYNLPEEDLEAIKESEENGDPTDEFIQEAEEDAFQNVPSEFLFQRLYDSQTVKDCIDEVLEQHRLRIEVIEH